MWHVDFACACALFLIFLFSPIPGLSLGSVDRPVPETMDGNKTDVFSGACEQTLAYSRANADNPAVPDRHAGLSKLSRNLCVLIKEQFVFSCNQQQNTLLLLLRHKEK
jgi:hypothetical protein